MNDAELGKWQTNSSKYLVDDKWLKLRADSCTTPDGHVIEPYYVFEYSDWIACVIIDDNNDAIMVNHYRYGVDEYIPELVCGMLEPEDSSPEEGARRELEEELGYVGGELYRTGVSYANPATHTNKVYSFLAIGGSCTQAQKLEKGENLHVIKMSLHDFVKAVKDTNSGATYQSIHQASIFLALNFIGDSSIEKIKDLARRTS